MNEIETIVSEMPPQNRAGSVLGLYDCALDALRRGFKVLPLMPAQRNRPPA
jgi:hypothetical protein